MFKKSVQNVEVGNLVTIKNYPAGHGYNRFVSYVPELAPVSLIDRRGVKRLIRAMICTATVEPDSELYKKLYEEAIKIPDCGDPEFMASKIILVDKKFMKLPNKQQLALLNIEFEKALDLTDGLAGIKSQMDCFERTSLEQQIGAEISTIELFGKRVFKRATRKAERLLRSSEFKATRGLHREYVKSIKAAKKAVTNNKSSVLESVEIDDMAATTAEDTNVKTKTKKEKFSALREMTRDNKPAKGIEPEPEGAC